MLKKFNIATLISKYDQLQIQKGCKIIVRLFGV